MSVYYTHKVNVNWNVFRLWKCKWVVNIKYDIFCGHVFVGILNFAFITYEIFSKLVSLY